MTPADLDAQAARLKAATPYKKQMLPFHMMGEPENPISTFINHAVDDLALCHAELRRCWAELEKRTWTGLQHDVHSPICKTCETQQQEIARLRGALEQFGAHDPLCKRRHHEKTQPPVIQDQIPPACQCGLTAAQGEA